MEKLGNTTVENTYQKIPNKQIHLCSRAIQGVRPQLEDPISLGGQSRRVSQL